MNELQRILQENRDKRVIIVGTVCISKDMMDEVLPGVRSMSQALWPITTPVDKEQLRWRPWSRDTWEFTRALVNEKIKIQAGSPMYGTVFTDCDMIVYLDADIPTLRKYVSRIIFSDNNIIDMDTMLRKEIIIKYNPTIINVRDLEKEPSTITPDHCVLSRIKSMYKQIIECELAIATIDGRIPEDEHEVYAFKMLVEEHENQIKYLYKLITDTLNKAFGVYQEEVEEDAL